MNKTCLVASATLLLVLAARPSEAGAPPSTEVGFAGSYVHGHRPGAPGLQGFEPQVTVRQGVAPDWDLFLRASLALFPQDRGTDLFSVVGGVALVIDAATWIPAVFAGVGYQGAMVRGDLAPNGVVVGGALLDRRFPGGIRAGIGGEVRVPWLQRSRLPWLAAVTLRLLWGPEGSFR
ncbi:MAG TPA: hypothetical protein PLQ97_08325 [Myxococcota bacterium]|nr:hypothetical protein [Myxococcota bacterium]HQK50829.1 hypothetical protein [Myxococcota bacterium]